MEFAQEETPQERPEDMQQEEEETEFQTDVQEVTDYVESDFDEGASGKTDKSVFGQSLDLLQLSSPECVVLVRSFDMLVSALGGDRESVGDAIYGALTSSLVCIKESFTSPRAMLSLRLFNGFRVLAEKTSEPEELKTFVETLAFRHLGNEVTSPRVETVSEGFIEILEQNVPDPPPGSAAIWRQVLEYTGSCFRYVNENYGARLKLIKEDWESIQTAAEKDTDETVVHSFGGMCAFSNEVMGQETEGWMEELLQVFSVLVDKIASPSILQEECDLLSICMVSKSKEIDFQKFKPVMLAALRSLLPKTWSTSHETAWEWLWATVSRNLAESTMKVRAFKAHSQTLFSSLEEEQLEHFRTTIYTEVFSKCADSQDLFKQSQTRLRYIADRVLRSSYDMFNKPKDEMVDDLSALGLRHVGYGVPIELFAPFTDSCVEVMKPLIESFPRGNSMKLVWCPADRAHQLAERDVPEHMMLEGFRWSIGLVSRLLIRTITEGSTAVMQAINQDDARRLRRALREAPRAERSSWQLRVRVGSQSISPLHWALRSGAHTVARTMIQDVLTIRADRDRYYYGVDDLFRLQADVVEHILREAPILAETLLDGLIWRSHKTQDGLRPVIYYLEHLVQDMDESQMLSRALVSFVKFKHPRTIMHPILTFVLDLLWENLAMRSFFFDRLLTVISFIVYLLATCFLNQRALIEKPPTKYCLVAARTLVYGMGFGRLLYWHTLQAYRSLVNKDLKKLFCLSVPRYLLHGAEMCSFALMINMIVMLMVEPLVHCLGSTEDMIGFTCEAWTDGMSLTYAVCLVAGIFLYSILVLEIGNISIELSEYRVLCLHAFKQVMLCIAVVSITIFTFSFAITGMILTREATNLSGEEWTDLGRVITTLVQLTVGLMDLGELHSVAEESPFLLIVVSLFMVVVYSFFFNLLVSQFCGVYSSLAADIKGHARLARGETILETLKTIEWKRWKTFVTSLALDRRVDFEEGDIGLAGGIKAFEAALEHPVSKDQIVRFGGQTDPSLPWPEHSCGEENSTEKMIQRTIQKSLQKMLGKKAVGSIDDTSSSHPSSSHRSDISG